MSDGVTVGVKVGGTSVAVVVAVAVDVRVELGGIPVAVADNVTVTVGVGVGSSVAVSVRVGIGVRVGTTVAASATIVGTSVAVSAMVGSAVDVVDDCRINVVGLDSPLVGAVEVSVGGKNVTIVPVWAGVVAVGVADAATATIWLTIVGSSIVALSGRVVVVTSAGVPVRPATVDAIGVCVVSPCDGFVSDRITPKVSANASTATAIIATMTSLPMSRCMN